MLGAPFSPSFAKKTTQNTPNQRTRMLADLGRSLLILKVSQVPTSLARHVPWLGMVIPPSMGSWTHWLIYIYIYTHYWLLGSMTFSLWVSNPPQLTPSLGYARCTTHKHLRQPTDGFKAKGVDALPDWRVPMLLAELVANLQMNHRMIHVTVSSINVKKPKSNKCKSFLHIFATVKELEHLIVYPLQPCLKLT